VIFWDGLLLPPSQIEIFSSAPCFLVPSVNVLLSMWNTSVTPIQSRKKYVFVCYDTIWAWWEDIRLWTKWQPAITTFNFSVHEFFKIYQCYQITELCHILKRISKLQLQVTKFQYIHSILIFVLNNTEQFKETLLPIVQLPDKVWVFTYLHPNCHDTKEKLTVWISRSSTIFLYK
jgi:hypothetical protein